MKMRFQLLPVILLGLMPVLATAALQNGKIQTDVTIGEVYTLDAKAKPVKVIPGQYYEQGSSFSTKADSTIQLVFSNGATLLLSPNTSVIVRTFKQVPVKLPAQGKYLEIDREPSPSVTEIILERGKVTGEVRKLNSQSSYTIRTGVGIVKIKGTIYTVAYTEDVAKGAGNIDTSCVKGSVDLTLFGSNTGAVPVEAGKRIVAQGPIVDENGSPRDVLAIKTIAEARETKRVMVNTTQGLSKGMVAEGEGVPPGTKIESIDSETEVTLSVPITVSEDTKLKFKKGEDNAAVDIPEIIPISISISKLDAKQIGDIATVLSTGSSLPVEVINVIKEKALQAPPPGSPEVALSQPVNPNDLPDTSKKTTVPPPPISQIINTVVTNTQTVIEREQQTNPSPVQ